MMPRFHLVVDEIVPAAKFQFRVRVWRRADSQPLVLLSQIKGHPPPDWCSSALANLVLRSFLGYSLPVPMFYEVSRWEGDFRAFRVRFETIGCELRPILHNPSWEPLDRKAVGKLFKFKFDVP
jgi:hypothetical protein